ncbi:MAG: hypothetical protein K2G95_03870, partial [Muribaculaceae bacterium]|nr:hypothetical protein [Muribaculaceae bacterium]
MNCITLDNILPDAFAADKTSPGDVWGRRVSFVRGEKVRIEASSGSGKTTLCAFIMGTVSYKQLRAHETYQEIV